ncbi:type I restriction-modification system, restriction subunit R [Kluyvera georgiana ATCC 51603]|uniref:Type I restriction-modification system, restriction subunit R n=1 Tax=Kluyvera georgiana ATCC 51603 TaxID=1354264 RepID=A0A1B7K6P9_9ENTR|nr:type I restriction-modification system, restriction subunit R [Kluyvera georgiana ATCC 51603]
MVLEKSYEEYMQGFTDAATGDATKAQSVESSVQNEKADRIPENWGVYRKI